MVMFRIWFLCSDDDVFHVDGKDVHAVGNADDLDDSDRGPPVPLQVDHEAKRASRFQRGFLCPLRRFPEKFLSLNQTAVFVFISTRSI